MTPKAMAQTALNHWTRNYPQEIRNSPKTWLQRQAEACAQLTRLEMDVLVAGGLDEKQAWTEARNLFCLKPPPKYDPSTDNP